MVKNHIKRINAPKSWDILRKDDTFISRPNPGRDMSFCISLNSAVKDVLGKVNTTKETKYLIKYKGLLVNGVRRHDEKFPLGFMDVLTLPDVKEHYRLLVNEKGKLFLHQISEAEAGIKLSKISNKRQLTSGVLQVNCTDGRNFLFKEKDASMMKDAGINDTIIYSIPEQKLQDVFKLQKGALVYLYKGKHIGHVVNVEDFKEGNILFKLGSDTYETKKTYAFVIGKDRPAVSLLDQKQNIEKKEARSRSKKNQE